MNYLVTWDIELDADSPEETAKEALKIHRDPMSIATVFKVEDKDGKSWKVDLNTEPGYVSSRLK